MTRVYRMFHGMDGEQRRSQATLVFGDHGMCEWVSNEEAFASFFPGHIYRLTLDEISSSMTSRVFVPVAEDDPDYPSAEEAAQGYVQVKEAAAQTTWEASVRALAAASEFLGAVWESRTNVTLLPPRMLADHLRRNSHELRGDDDLPDHLDTAADAFEGLPRAAMGKGTPEYYDGPVEDYLLDAERVFRSVATRLLRLTPRGGGPV